MIGLTILPATAHESVPGQVPGMTDTSRPPPRYTLRDLNPTLKSVIEQEANGAPNELAFRRGVMAHLLEGHIPSVVRREILTRALRYYRAKFQKSDPATEDPKKKPSVAGQQGRRRGPASGGEENTSTKDSVKQKPNPDPWESGAAQQNEEAVLRAQIVDAEYPDLDSAESPGALRLSISAPCSSDAPPSGTQKSARGGKYYRRIPKPGGGYQYVYSPSDYSSRDDAHLEGEAAQNDHVKKLVGRELERFRSMGMPTAHLAPLVQRHGAQAVASALRSFGRVVVDSKTQTLSVHKSKPVDPKLILRRPRELARAEAEQLPNQGEATSEDRADPVGSRKVWNRRIVEKKPDGKWHVVGQVAGLEDPKKVPPLDTSKLSPEHVQHLLSQIRQNLHAKPKTRNV